MDEGTARTELPVLVERELVPLLPTSKGLISVDGLDGVGKSTLAQTLSECTGAALVQLDELLRQNQDTFLQALDLVELRRRVRKKDLVIVEGCTVLAALEKIAMAPDLKIYVVRTSRMLNQPNLEWVDEHELLLGDRSASELIQEEEEQSRRWVQAPVEFGGGGSPELPGLVKELITYHRDFAPHQSADIVVKVVRIA